MPRKQYAEWVNIQHEDGEKGAFFIDDSGERVAELQYSRPADDRINIYHTEVSDKLAGQGIGKKLVAAAIEYARGHGLTVEATCPYAHKVIERTAEFHDVMPKAV